MKARTRGALAIVVFAVAMATLIAPAARRGALTAPPEVGDAHDYDVIAHQLVKGRGFAFDWDDPEYRAPYERANQGGRYDAVLARHGAGLTTYRPPVLPVLMAGVYATVGRSFASVRLMNAGFMALACALAFVVVYRALGAVPAVLQCVLFLADPRIHAYATRILTESLACLLVVVLLATLLRLHESPRIAWAVLLGATCGAATLSRGIFVLWLPIVFVLAFAVTRTRAATLTALALATTLAVIAPWAVRNCVVLQAFYPLGTQGAISMSSGYSDEAVQEGGYWFSQGERGFFDAVVSPGQSPLEEELAMAKNSTARARQWMAAHVDELPRLAAWKALSVWTPRGTVRAVLLIASALGVVMLARTAPVLALIVVGLLAANTLAVAATWTVGARFTIPVLPLLSLTAAAGASGLIGFIAARGWVQRASARGVRGPTS